MTGDRYAGEWVVEAFAKHHVHYRHSERKSELYLESLPLFAQGAVDLLDYQPLTMELMQLERRTARAAKSVDHPPAATTTWRIVCAAAWRWWPHGRMKMR